ncbi:MAG: hypothetical protein FJY83_01605 [Candidatus Aminicenantes bacterium]|nr:hypothetical protein [Candidatus Aminicenantes bacterium]
MSGNINKIGGAIQALFGAAGQFVPGAGEVLTTTSTDGNIFNMVSGVLLGAVGLQKSQKTAKVVGPVVGIVNAAAGVLGLTGNSGLIPGFQLNSGTPQVAVNFIIAAIGILGPFLKKKK